MSAMHTRVSVRSLVGLSLLLLGLLSAACLPPVVVTPTPGGAGADGGAEADTAGASYSDPFAYCAAVGTIDEPDARYTGPAISESVANGLGRALGLEGTPPPPVAQNSFWRCMDGKVYACTVGANLPCQEKADLNRTPSEAVEGFCEQNPDSDVVPMVVTGRATVFEWRCTGGEPEIVRQLAEADARGYLSGIWYELASE